MKVTVIGPGGVGGYFGFKLARQYSNSPHVQIFFVARGKAFEVINETGLTLLSNRYLNPSVKPHFLIPDVSDLKDQNMIIICVKEYDLDAVCEKLATVVEPGTVMIPLMNGVNIYERIRKKVPHGIILPSCVYVASHVKRPGTIEHSGSEGKITIGRDPQNRDHEVVRELDVLKAAGIDVTLREDSLPDIWTKFCFIASFGLVTTRYNKSIGEVYEKVVLRKRVSAIVEEIEAIARRKGIDLPVDIQELTLKKAAEFPFQTRTSLQLDVIGKKPRNELALFSGAILNYGRELGIQVPETEQITGEIAALQ